MNLLHNNPYSLILITFLTFLHFPSRSNSQRCRTECGSVPVHYPFSIDDGCGAPQFRHMFTCNTTSPSLFFMTTNGNYKVQSIDYKSQTVTVFDPDMSTCTILQPHHDLVMSDLQFAIIPPSPDTVFALLNCSVNSPILHRFRSLCFDLPGHQCQDLYSSCNSFRVFTSGPSISYGYPGAPGLGAPVAPDNTESKVNFPINNIPPSNLPNTGVPAPGLPNFPIYNNPPPSLGGTGGAPPSGNNYVAPSVPNNFPIFNNPPPPSLGDTGGGPSGNYYGGPPSNFPIYNNPPPSLGDTGGGTSGTYYGGPPNNFPIYNNPPPSLGDTGGGPSGTYYGGPPSNFPIYNNPPPIPGGSTGDGPSGNYYGGPPNNFPVYNNPPAGPGDTPVSPINFPINNNPPMGPGGTGGVPSGNYYGTPGVPSSTGGVGPSTGPAPPCCFTGYSTLKVMKMEILDCTHFTSFYNVDKLKGVSPMEWSYGLKFSYSVPDMGCERCKKSGGSCGFDVETEALLCLCSNSNNSTRQCGTGEFDAGERWAALTVFEACIIGLGVFFFLLSDSTILST